MRYTCNNNNETSINVIVNAISYVIIVTTHGIGTLLFLVVIHHRHHPRTVVVDGNKIAREQQRLRIIFLPLQVFQQGQSKTLGILLQTQERVTLQQPLPQFTITRITRIPVLCFQRGKAQRAGNTYMVFPPVIHRMIRGRVRRLPVVDHNNNQVREFKVPRVLMRRGTQRECLRVTTLLLDTLWRLMQDLAVLSPLERDLRAGLAR